MSPAVNRYLPPGLVLASTLYFGWPPATALIQDDDTVRITAVRWKPDDLKPAPPITITSDPFASVLVVSDKHEIEEETGKLIPATQPAGPDPKVLRKGLVLTGIADVGGRKWAILNGRPRMPGDTIHTNDIFRHKCEVVSVAGAHVVVRCEETIAEIEVSKKRRPSDATEPSGVEETTAPPIPPNLFEAMGAMAN